MLQSTLKDVTTPNLEFYIQESRVSILNKMYYPRFFPSKPVLSFDYKTVLGSEGVPVAGDIVTYNAEHPIKSRKVIGTISGEIPPIKMKKEMTEKDYNDYLVMVNDPRAELTQLINLIYNDSEACYQGIQSRKEWMALQLLSKCELEITAANNNGAVTAHVVGFGLPAAHKRVIKSASSTRKWADADADNPKPYTDINDIYEAALEEGIMLTTILMDRSTFHQMRKTTEVIQLTNKNTTNLSYPTLEAINSYLLEQDLPTIEVINQRIGLEGLDGTVTNVNPWDTNYITFIYETKQGDFLEAPIAAENVVAPHIAQTKQDGVLLQKFNEPSPFKEVTTGQSNAFPSWSKINEVYRLKVTDNAADGLDD